MRSEAIIELENCIQPVLSTTLLFYKTSALEWAAGRTLPLAVKIVFLIFSKVVFDLITGQDLATGISHRPGATLHYYKCTNQNHM